MSKSFARDGQEHRDSPGTFNAPILLHLTERNEGIECARPPPFHTLSTVFGEWLSLVEHLVRDQGVGGSNPLSPTILSLQPLLR